MKHIKTTVYHLQTNGQVEYANQETKKYIHKYILYHQDNWSDLLVILKYIYNTKKSSERTFISYQIIYGEISLIMIKKDIQEIQLKERQITEIEKKERKLSVSEYQTSDWIYLSRREERKDRSNQSLNHRWWGLFKIKRHTNLQNVEFELFKQMKIYSIINVYNIKKYYGPSPKHIEQSFIQQDIKEYGIEKSTEERENPYRFRIQWTDYQEQTWKSAENLIYCQDILCEWKKRKNDISSDGDD